MRGGPVQAWGFVNFIQNEEMTDTIILLNEASLNNFNISVSRTKIAEGGGGGGLRCKYFIIKWIKG